MVLDMTQQLRPAGEALRTLRRIAGLNLDQAAAVADTAAAYLSKVENGKLVPTVGYVANVTAALARHLQDTGELKNKVAS
ncbi:MAG: helix-turn-helix transcriptional regulator [Actinobacteria bacterium]|nr:helix-turn-helix transcriptional regulator [Actinomycetota bacterium]